ncbi:hypothetical protein J437_LFUL000987 [Ladona fulva]|uniref:Carboxylesterase type B domain-containing protein n=1 Tax=Ladona fulva TaxID=123851 RepID=A0A8K0KGH9_LADFU|nr:hypothetical protein J437_LFUL000987 [Ladona fulva]
MQRMGTVHGEDLPYIFGAPNPNEHQPKADGSDRGSRERNRFKNIVWEEYDSVHQKYLEIVILEIDAGTTKNDETNLKYALVLKSSFPLGNFAEHLISAILRSKYFLLHI